MSIVHDLLKADPEMAFGVATLSGTGTADGAIQTTFKWASVTKLLTTMAILIAVEEGSLNLDDPVGPDGSTLTHLLAHASGLPFEGERPIAGVASRRIYSNTGINKAAAHLEMCSGVSFESYLREAVLEPLGMKSTQLKGSAAAGAIGPLVELLAFSRELLSPTLIHPQTLFNARTVKFPGLNGVLPGFGRQRPCDWGLGFEIKSDKDPHWTSRHNSPETFGHFGQSGSFIWVDPSVGIACAYLGSRSFGPWAAQVWPELSDHVLKTYSS